MRTVGIFVVHYILLCAFTAHSVRVRRGYAQLSTWTEVTSFCYLPSAGHLTYRVTSTSYDVYLHVYTTSVQHSAANITQNVTYSTVTDDAADVLDGLNDGNYSTWRPATVTPPVGNMSTRVTPVTGNIAVTEAEAELCNDTPVKRSNIIASLLVWAQSSAGDMSLTWPSNDVMCVNVAMSTRCRKVNDVLIDISLTNVNKNGNSHDRNPMDAPIVSFSSLSFLWRHLSADSLTFPATDTISLVIVCVLLLCAICIRRNIMQRALYSHAVSSCCLSLALLLLYLLSRVLLHGIYLFDGKLLSTRVHVVVDLTLHVSHALFLLALLLHALRHTWCNPPHRFRVGYVISVTGCSVAIVYALCLVAIQGFEAFTQHALIAQYSVLALKILLWLVFVILVISTVLHPKDNNSYKGSTLRLDTRGPSSKQQLRSLFGDYDYPTPLASLASPEHMHDEEEGEEEHAGDGEPHNNVPNEEGPGAYFDHSKTKNIPEDSQSWVGIEVSGHKDYEAEPLGGLDILIYTLWFLTVPLLALWTPFLLPYWMNKQCVYALHLCLNILAYIYFLTCAAIFRQRSTDVSNAPTNTTTTQQPRTRTIEQLTVI